MGIRWMHDGRPRGPAVRIGALRAEVLRRVRSLEMARDAERNIPALALTAFTQIERERLSAAGFADRVDKPVDAEKLVGAIRAVVKDRRQKSRAQAR